MLDDYKVRALERHNERYKGKKKIATLTVYLDENSDEPSSCGGVCTPDGKIVDDQYTLLINTKETAAKKDLLGVVCHELGHFASQILRTPAAVKDKIYSWTANAVNQRLDLRLKDDPWSFFPAAIRARYAAESEAWDNARKMGLPINEAEAERCLDTYREGVRHIERNLTPEQEKIENEKLDTAHKVLCDILAEQDRARV